MIIGASRQERARTRRKALDWAITALAAVAVCLFVQQYFLKPYRIPSASMERSLRNGDRIAVDRISWRLRGPHRYEIAVFHPRGQGIAFVKRIVGIPGDVLMLRKGELYVNGLRAPQSYVPKDHGAQVPTEAVSNGKPWSLQLPYTVPAKTYFMMGDNRAHSEDSRDFGPIPRGQLIGRVLVRYWPPSRIGVPE